MNRILIAKELVRIATLLVADAKPKPERLDPKTIREVNKYLYSISTGNVYYERLPANDVFDHLKKFGIIPLQEDGTPWSGFLLGREGYVDLEVGRDLGNDKVGPPFKNTFLHMNWHKMESGKYEFMTRLT